MKAIITFGGVSKNFLNIMYAVKFELEQKYGYDVECSIEDNILTVIGKTEAVNKEFDMNKRNKLKYWTTLKPLGVKIKVIKD